MLKNLMLAALLGLSLYLPVPAMAVDGEVAGQSGGCKSFSVIEHTMREAMAGLQKVRLTEDQKEALAARSNMGEFTGVEAYTLSVAGDPTTVIVLVQGDCAMAVAIIPTDKLQEIIGGGA
jgi:hypothetical protein